MIWRNAERSLGLVLSTIGMDPMEGVERFMFGQDALL